LYRKSLVKTPNNVPHPHRTVITSLKNSSKIQITIIHKNLWMQENQKCKKLLQGVVWAPGLGWANNIRQSFDFGK